MLRGNLLHVGGGGSPLPEWAQGVTETTLDINPNVKPDIVASMVDMGDIGGYDFVFSCHCLEHVHQYQVPIALSEMHRVLKDGGINFVMVPDLTDVKPTKEVIYECEAGPVSGLDIIYGMGSMIEDNPAMAHKSGFTMDSLKEYFEEAGFKNINGIVINEFHSIMVIGEK